jgi:hypothetical protein
MLYREKSGNPASISPYILAAEDAHGYLTLINLFCEKNSSFLIRLKGEAMPLPFPPRWFEEERGCRRKFC